MISPAVAGLAAFAEAVERSPVAIWATESALAYPVANTAHVIGVILLVGAIGLLDLRVLGYARGAPMAVLVKALTRLALAGFMVMVLSGAVLFAADAAVLAESRLFQVKLILIALAGLNALAFRLLWHEVGDPAPAGARIIAATSLGLWMSVVVAGRWIAYA